MDVHHVGARCLPQVMFHSFKDAHVDGQGTRRLGNKPEKGYRPREEIPERLLIDELVERWVPEGRCEGKEIAPLSTEL